MIVRNRRAYIGGLLGDPANAGKAMATAVAAAHSGGRLTGNRLAEYRVGSAFHHVTAALARFIGRPLMMVLCLVLAIGSIAAYASHDSLLIDGTNLAINVLTLLVLPILQATQNRDGAALQAKLDELIKVNKEARNDLLGIEDRDEEEIEEMRAAPETVTDPHPHKESVA
jgi:low affinity Fe/Cu permease